MITASPTVVEVEVDGKTVEYLRTFTVPAIGALMSLGPSRERYNVKVVKQHWVIDHPSLNPDEFRCILICERTEP